MRVLDDLFIFFGMLFIAWAMASCNSHWFPFLLSADFFVRIPGRRLQTVLIFGSYGWDRKIRVAPEDQDKMSLTGLITYAAFAADILGIIVLRMVLAFCMLSPPLADRLYRIYMILGKNYPNLGLGLFLLGCLDYYIGKSGRR